MTIGCDRQLENGLRRRLEAKGRHGCHNRCDGGVGCRGKGMVRTHGIGVGWNGISEPLPGHG